MTAFFCQNKKTLNREDAGQPCGSRHYYEKVIGVLACLDGFSIEKNHDKKMPKH